MEDLGLRDMDVLHLPRPPGSIDRDWLEQLLRSLTPDAAAIGGKVIVELVDEEEAVARFAASYWGWIVSGYLQQDTNGSLSIRQITLEPELRHDGGITHNVWRGVNPTKLLAEARSLVTAAAQEKLDLIEPKGAADELEELVATSRKRGPGRPSKYPNEYIRLVAMLYLRLQKDGFTRGILDEMAHRLTTDREHPMDRERARDLVHLARKRGYLTSGKPGRAGADPGPRLRREFEQRNIDPFGRPPEKKGEGNG